MTQPFIRYRFYPSLLDSYQNYLDAEKTWEKYWGSSEDPSMSLEEYLDKVESELIDKINRVPQDPSEAADKGTCFNEIVDRINSGGVAINNDVKLVSHTHLLIDKSEVDEIGKPIVPVIDEKFAPHIEAQMDGFTFLFDIDTCKNAAEYFKDCLPQHLCKANIETRYGWVELYGYADEIRGDKVFDIKTTGQYEYGKFCKAWQKEIYPYCLTESGDMEGISEFEYTVFVLGKKDPITAKMYKESYPYVHSRAKERIRLFCESFIEFLQIHDDKITDTKIKGQ